MPLNIAMDGPVGAGKSSIANAVAKELNILHLDTGAMYRTIGLAALRQGIDLQDEAAVTHLAETIDVGVQHAADGQHTLLAGEDVSGLIRTEQVSMAASTVARYAGVRRAMVALQQKLAAQTDMLGDTVLCDDPTLGDALSTALFVMGVQDAAAWVERTYPQVAAMFVDESNEPVFVNGFVESSGYTLSEG